MALTPERRPARSAPPDHHRLPTGHGRLALQSELRSDRSLRQCPVEQLVGVVAVALFAVGDSGELTGVSSGFRRHEPGFHPEHQRRRHRPDRESSPDKAVVRQLRIRPATGRFQGAANRTGALPLRAKIIIHSNLAE